MVRILPLVWMLYHPLRQRAHRPDRSITRPFIYHPIPETDEDDYVALAPITETYNLPVQELSKAEMRRTFNDDSVEI